MVDRWTAEEVQTLRSHLSAAGREEIRRLLPAHSYRSVKAKAYRLGLLRRPTEAELRERGEAGQSLREIGRAFDLNEKTIRACCLRHGVALRSQPEAASLANRNTIPDALLCPPLDPSQSWLLGIIATDGNLSDGGRLRVSGADEDIVRQCHAVAACGSVHVEHGHGRHPMFVWSYTALGLQERLAPFGITPRKTFALRFPDPRFLHLPSFVRGCWDGDGYWRIADGELAGGFGSSSLAFIEAMWEHLKPVAESTARVYKHPSKEHWVLRVDRGRARRLAAWMYGEPCETYCARKRAPVLSSLGDA